MVKKWLIACLVIAFLLDEANSSLPSPSEANMRFYLTQKGLDYASDIMMNKTGAVMEGQKVAPVKITKSVLWNTIRLSLSNSKMKSVILGSTSVYLENGKIKLLLALNSLEVVGDYNYKGGIFGKGQGTYSMKLKNVWITKYLSIATNAEGDPFLKDGACSNWIQDTSIVFTGGSSFAINLLVSLAKSSVNNDVRKKICTSVTEAIDKKGKTLPTLYPERHNISRVECAQLNIPILQQPLILINYIDFLIEGGIISNCYKLNNFSSGERVSRIQYLPSPSKMITILVSDRLINSLVDLFYKAGVMQLDVIQSNDSLSLLRVAMNLKSPPVINTTTNSSMATFKIDANITTSSLIETIQTFGVELDVQSDFHLEEDDMKISGILKNLRWKPFFSEDISEGKKDLVLPTLKMCSVEILNQINGFLYKMAALPMISDIKFKNKHFFHKEGYTVFESDVSV